MARLATLVRAHPDAASVVTLTLLSCLVLGRGLLPGNVLSAADNLFLVLAGSYTDLGASNVAPLIGRTTYVLHPRHKQAEYFTSSSGVA